MYMLQKDLMHVLKKKVQHIEKFLIIADISELEFMT